jgi:hypothetical protein
MGYEASGLDENVGYSWFAGMKLRGWSRDKSGASKGWDAPTASPTCSLHPLAFKGSGSGSHTLVIPSNTV